MHPSEIPSSPAARPRVTVAAIAERGGRFLLVREFTAEGGLVINQPAGHLEAGESLLAAVIRETREETGWEFVPRALVGIYQWQHPASRVSFVRFAICGDVTTQDPQRSLDEGIEEVLWLTAGEVTERRVLLRSPLVTRCIEDYLRGVRYPVEALQFVAGGPSA